MGPSEWVFVAHVVAVAFVVGFLCEVARAAIRALPGDEGTGGDDDA